MLPSWVQHGGGRLTPFDADVISRHLFAAAQTIGPADAFVIRELTDSVLHFIVQEDLGDTANAERIKEIVEKVIRELGQPGLARAFVQRSSDAPDDSPRRPPLSIDFSPDDRPEEIAGRCLDAFALRAVVAADIAAAHEQGLIHLGGLRTPQMLDAIVLEPATVEPIGAGDPFDAAWDLVANGAERAGRALVLDGPEWMVADDAIPRFLRGLDRAAQALGRTVDVHVNAATPPAWAETRGAGPLFVHSTARALSSPRAWLAAWSQAGPGLRLAWHWRNDPNSDAPFVDWLTHGPQHWLVIFDRPRQPIALSLGLSRRRPGILIGIGLDLPALLNRRDVSCQGDVFLDKLPSLARMAVSAGAQKRTYLRRHAGPLAREFLLERAAVRLEPLGFATVMQQLLGVPAPITKPARTLARKILVALQSPFEDCRKRTGLELVLNAPELPPLDPSARDVVRAYDELARGNVDTNCLAWRVDDAVDGNSRSAFMEVVACETTITGLWR